MLEHKNIRNIMYKHMCWARHLSCLERNDIKKASEWLQKFNNIKEELINT